MTDQGLTDADRARIAHFLSKPRYDRTYRDLVPADEPDVDSDPDVDGEPNVDDTAGADGEAGDDTDGGPVRDADDRDEDD